MKTAACLLLAACLASADQPAFEAASIKVSDSPSNGMNGYIGIRPGGSISVRNITLEFLIYLAYGIEAYRVSGGPGWMSIVRYNVDAKPAAPVSEKEAHLMFQNLLTERFHLQVHYESKSVDGYMLTAPKGEGKLQKLPPEALVGFRQQAMGQLKGPGTMDMLARTLKGMLGAPVEDATGLEGKYEMDLEWSLNETIDDGKPSVFAALSERLGLVLKRSKVPVEMLIVDHAEKATPN